MRCIPALAARRAATRAVRGTRGPARRPRVLFLCTGNSARSQIAEALLEHMSAGDDRSRAARAAIRSRCIPNAVRVMRKRGIDISANRTKHLDEFVAPTRSTW